MPKDNAPVPVVPTSKASGNSSHPPAWSKPSSFFKDRRRQQSGGVSVPQTGLWQDIQTLRLYDVGTVRLFHAAEKAGFYDDDNLLLERLIQLLYKLPRHSRQGKLLTDAFITKLWSTLDHPQPKPIPSLMGHAHRHRTADGSNSNPYLATLGAAGTAYARAVTPMDVQSPDMPDPGLVFDTLMRREDDKYRPHPTGISSMMFYLGVIITHDIFQTDSRDGGINLASSYLDLAPLYGNSYEEQKSMREFHDGRLKPDCFAHMRVLSFPPACCVFLLMFNRFHNYVVTQLAKINEGDRFKKPTSPPDSSDPAWKKYDEDLFQTGRLVTCGLYINIVLKDYVRAILCLNRTDSTWTIDPRSNMARHAPGGAPQKEPAPTGVGNQVSVEFNLLYRWHSIISKRDAEWTSQEMRKMLGGDKDPESATFHEMIMAFHAWEKALPQDPHERNSVPGLEREADGAYNDDELVKILKEGIEDRAGSFGAKSVPSCLRPVEMLGILQARRWRVGTLNEFRDFIGLTRHKTFEDINPDPSVAAGLRTLYGNPANVELYPGLVSEKTKPPMAPGSGVCVGYTASRAILSDAVALVRGDRFYTDDFTPKNLTNWGFAEVDSDLDVDSGNVMYKLIMCAFPHHFQSDSIYAHHPLITPDENKIIFEGLNRSSDYSWDPPRREAEEEPLPSKESSAAPAAAADGNTLNHTHKKPLPPLTTPPSLTSFLSKQANQLLTSHTHPIPCRSALTLDLISDLLAPLFVRLTASLFSLSLKHEKEDKSSRRGAYTDSQLSLILSVLYAAESPKLSPGRSYELRRQAQDLVTGFKKAVVPGKMDMLNKAATGGGGGGHLYHNKDKNNFAGYGDGMIAELVRRRREQQQQKEKRSGGGKQMKMRMSSGERGGSWKKQQEAAIADRVAKLVACSAMVPVLLVAESLDHHLDLGDEHMAWLRELASSGNGDGLLRHFLDGCSLRPSSPSPAPATEEEKISSEPTDTRRPISSYFPQEARPQDLEIYTEAMAAVFQFIIVSLPGLRRAPGPQGMLKSVPFAVWHGQVGRCRHKEEEQGTTTTTMMYMTGDRSSFWPVPTGMKILWRGDQDAE